MSCLDFNKWLRPPPKSYGSALKNVCLYACVAEQDSYKHTPNWLVCVWPAESALSSEISHSFCVPFCVFLHSLLFFEEALWRVYHIWKCYSADSWRNLTFSSKNLVFNFWSQRGNINISAINTEQLKAGPLWELWSIVSKLLSSTMELLKE